MELLAKDFGQLFEAAFGELEVGGLEAFLRAVDASAAIEPQQRIMHIDGDDQFVKRQWLICRTNLGQRMQFGPANDLLVMPIEKFPIQSAGHAEAAVVARAAADADEATL